MANLRKTAILGALGLAMLAGAPDLFAQGRARAGGAGGAGPGARTEQREGFLQRNLDQLHLTDEQKAKIDPIVQESREKIREAVQKGDRESARTEMRSLHDKINPILTQEQRTKLRELMRERMGATTQPAGQMNMVGRVKAAVEDLNLSDDQKTKLDDLFKTYAAQIEDIRKNAGEDRQAAQQQIRPLFQDLLNKVKAVLTPEQSEKLDQKIQSFREQRQGKQGEGRQRPGNRARNRQGAAKD